MEGGTFKFNFKAAEERSSHQSVAHQEPRKILPPPEEHVARDRATQDNVEEVQIEDGFTLLKGRISSDQAAALIKDERVTSNDVVSGIYEGGFKLWECSLDLSRYLISRYHLSAEELFETSNPHTQLKGKKVLELGCGHGLPGLMALLAGASVTFQDFNKEVIDGLTIPNAMANLKQLPSKRELPGMRFFSGDWTSVARLMTSRGLGGHYDVILTSETIYNTEDQHSLLECIKQLLQPPHGVVFVAAKTYYFGVGGGTKSFRGVIETDGIFEVETVFRHEDKASGNVREILQLKFPDSIMPYFL